MESILKFLPNRVLRLYHGGSGIDRLHRASNPADTRFPEEWIASCIEGNGRAYHSPGHGISRIEVDGKEYSFPEFLGQHAAEVLGREHVGRFGKIPGVLAKLLDSAERLPLQVHPSRSDALKYFNSPFGKTEAWIVLAVREVNGEAPYLLAGFNETLDERLFRAESLAGTYEKGIDMLHKLRVVPGDVVVIDGGLPHAIGPGVTMVEVMEPSDLVIVPEINCCGSCLTEKQRFGGIAPDTALDLFDWRKYSPEELRRHSCPVPEVAGKGEGWLLKQLIPASRCGYFSVWKLEFDGVCRTGNGCGVFRIGILTAGRAEINGVPIEQGESFLIPQSCVECTVSGSGEIVMVLPPGERGEAF